MAPPSARPALAAAALGALIAGAAAAGPWETAAAQIRAEWQVGDLVLVTPAWRRGELTHFDGIAAVADSTVRPAELAYFGRLWVVYAPEEQRRPLKPRSATLEHEATTAGLVIQRWKLPPPREVRFDFLARLSAAKVFVEKDDGARRACARDDRPDGRVRFRCPETPTWAWVGATTEAFRREPKRCVWMHPVPGERLVVRFEGVPGGGRLEGSAGLSDDGVRHRLGAPVQLAISVDGSEALKHVAASVPGLRPFSTELPAGDHAVEFRVSAADVGARFFCFEARVMEGAK